MGFPGVPVLYQGLDWGKKIGQAQSGAFQSAIPSPLQAQSVPTFPSRIIISTLSGCCYCRYFSTMHLLPPRLLHLLQWIHTLQQTCPTAINPSCMHKPARKRNHKAPTWLKNHGLCYIRCGCGFFIKTKLCIRYRGTLSSRNVHTI